jgi:hypothetical protein
MLGCKKIHFANFRKKTAQRLGWPDAVQRRENRGKLDHSTTTVKLPAWL